MHLPPARTQGPSGRDADLGEVNSRINMQLDTCKISYKGSAENDSVVINNWFKDRSTARQVMCPSERKHHTEPRRQQV